MIDELRKKIDNYYQMEQGKRFPCHSNRASQLGHPCLRYLVYLRTMWEQQEQLPLGLIRIFKDGEMQEKNVAEILRKAGIDIIRQGESFHWKKYNITGTIDGMILYDYHTYPVEIKSLSLYSFQKLDTIEDMLQSEKHYIRGYLSQMTCYLLLSEKERGIFILKNKNTAELKLLEYCLDYSFAEKIIQKAEEINRCVDEGIIPERNEDDYCVECSFRLICQPTIMNTPAEIDITGRLDDVLLKLEAEKSKIEENEKIIRDLENEKKKILEEIKSDKIITKNYFLKKTLVNVNPKPYSYDRWSIKKLSGDNE